MQKTDVEYVVSTDQAITTVEVSADIGNARAVVLVRAGEDVAPTAISLPAVRSLHGAFSWEVFASRGQSAGAWRSLKSDEHIIERDGIERFLGRLAVERIAASSSGRGSDARYHDGTTLDFILAGVAAAMPGANRLTVKLTTLLPISLWHLAPKVQDSLKGTHAFKYNGRDMRVTIAAVTVKREGEAAFSIIEGDTTGRLLIIDGGGRTVNLALFNAGEYRSGSTLELGVEAALDNLDKALIGRGGRALTLAERTELQAARIKGEQYFYICDGEPWQLADEAGIYLRATAAALVQEMRARVPVDHAQRIVFIGGAAYPALFGAAVKSALPLVELGGLRELANVYGALGVKKGKKK